MNREQQTTMELRCQCGGRIKWNGQAVYCDRCSIVIGNAGDATPPATPEPPRRPPSGWPVGLCRDVWNFVQDRGLTISEADELVALLAPVLSQPPAASGDVERLTKIAELLRDLRELEQHYSTDGVAHLKSRQIERIFDRWLHATPTPGAP